MYSSSIRPLPLRDLVTELFDKEAENWVESPKTYATLLDSKDDMITYLISEYNRVDSDCFRQHVTDFINLEDIIKRKFLPLLPILERLANKLEKSKGQVVSDKRLLAVKKHIKKIAERKQKDSPNEECFQFQRPSNRLPDPRIRNPDPVNVQSIFDNFNGSFAKEDSPVPEPKEDSPVPEPMENSPVPEPMEDSPVPEPARKKKRVSFHHETRDEPSISRLNESVTIALPLNDEPVTIDQKIIVDCNSTGRTYFVALPNQSHAIAAPRRIVFTKWDHDEQLSNPGVDTDRSNFELSLCHSTLPQLRYNDFHKNFPANENIDRILNLMINDTMLEIGIIPKRFRGIEQINVGYPRNPRQLIGVLNEETEAGRNDYILKNVFICLGLDFVCYIPDRSEIWTRIEGFLNDFAEQLRKTFAPDGPKRYYNPRNLAIEDLAPFQVSIPKMVLITIPYVQNDPHPTYKEDITLVNENLRRYVANNKKKWAKIYHQDLELYDWEMEARAYPLCSKEDVTGRLEVLYHALAKKYAIFMR